MTRKPRKNFQIGMYSNLSLTIRNVGKIFLLKGVRGQPPGRELKFYDRRYELNFRKCDARAMTTVINKLTPV